MSEASFASLGPTLLARKGGAKPAMRPQLAPLPETVADEQLEDLGWNDMGTDDESSADIVSINPKSSPLAANEDADDDVVEAESPIVVRQQKSLEERILADAVMTGEDEVDSEDGVDNEDDADSDEEIALIATKPRKTADQKPSKSKASKSVRRAAFTLRLDSDRHLKLRLASTMQGVSAQALVTEALDALLDQIEDLDALAERMKRN